MTTNPAWLVDSIRTIPDFPKPGIQFRDVTTLFGHAEAFARTIEELAAYLRSTSTRSIDAVAGIEARGFIIGGALANALGTGFLPIRKKGKLPYEVIGEDYELEYGTDRIEIHSDAIENDQHIVMVDDLIATGGTALAAHRLLKRAGADVEHALFIVDLPDLGGRTRLEEQGLKPYSLCAFGGH